MSNIENQFRTQELERPKQVKSPYQKKYVTDVLVIGCGFAGLNAAYSAKKEGNNVLVIDKGRPGYSGLSPWPSSFRWFDTERGDDADAYRQTMMKGGDYLSNLKWYDCWINESKEIYIRLKEWGILAQYPRAAEAGNYYQKEDFIGYRENYEKFDRHQRWIDVLEQNEIPYLEHTMITNIVQRDNRVCGAMGFHVPSGELITINTKAIVLATGGGSYKPTGYPVGGDTFDGEYMAYEMGLPIIGKEFEDFHTTSPQAPGNVFLDNHWQYLENIWLCGGDIEKGNSTKYASTKGNVMTLGRVKKALYGMEITNGSEIQDVSVAAFTRRGGSQTYESDFQEVRSGKMSTPVASSMLAGAATGMCSHLASGVFCGFDDEDGATSVNGLFVAGDGIHATSPAGAAYPCGVGFTSCFTSIDGDHAGKAAAIYSSANNLLEMDEKEIELLKAEILAPMNKDKGFDPNWARDVLHSIMAPYWVSVAKSEETLQAALIQVTYMKEHVIPNLVAATSHDLRLCIEMKHKVFSAELKLRASLARKESRGNSYRTDYPYRDDDNFLCYQGIRKMEGKMKFEKYPIPEEWAGDQTQLYQERFVYFFPGETDEKHIEVKETAWQKQKGGR